ncbi:hypothetical protein GOBAR_AA09129 [Gossypium barbadense]|uniref:Uncharacterized protein n=1 Tax=Gossypium barbadense TaxID=3634 RepID=A0A2P5Y7D8_GOSBA|nr:hypothetical protein GOBAR_AA09129 [Gossypium barbadense]
MPREEVIVVIGVVVAMVVVELHIAVMDDCGQKLQILKQPYELVGDSAVAVKVGPPEMQGYHQEYPRRHPHRLMEKGKGNEVGECVLKERGDITELELASMPWKCWGHRCL